MIVVLTLLCLRPVFVDDNIEIVKLASRLKAPQISLPFAKPQTHRDNNPCQQEAVFNYY